MATQIQRSLSGGEITPGLYGRADIAKYLNGLKTCRNFTIQRFGGAQNRPGTKFIAETKGSGAVRLIKFVFNASQTYVLEFGNLYMRVIKNGVQLGAPYEIASPYAAADLSTLQYIQSADVVTIVHPSYPPYELKRTADTAWTLTPISFFPTISPPNGYTVTAGGAGAIVYRYKITSVSSANSEESVTAYGTAPIASFTAINQANPAQVTQAAHGYNTGDQITILTAGAMTQVAGRTFTITVTGANTYTLNGENSTGYPASAGGTLQTLQVSVQSAAPTSGAPIVVSWTAVAGAKEYNVYKADANGVYGFIGIAAGQGTVSFNDINITPDFSDGPTEYSNPFAAAGDYPAAVAYFQQRLCFACTTNNPEKVWMSQTGNYHNFTTHKPLQDDDAISFTCAGEEVNAVRHLIGINKSLAIFTSGGDFTLSGDAPITPTSINPLPNGREGAGYSRPMRVRNSIIYLQARGSVLSDYQYDLNADGFVGADLTIFSAHLFDGYQIGDMDFAAIPNRVGWAVRSDGVLLGLTYVREQEVAAWHRHDTDGTFENIVALPEGTEDAVYVVVKRTIGGVTKRYIERFATRKVTDIKLDAFFVDCGLSYNGTNLTATTMTLTAPGGAWTVNDSLTLTASASVFTAADVGNSIVETIGGVLLELRIIAYTSGTVVTVQPLQDVPLAFQGVATAVWSRAVDEVAGLTHLEGKTVAILGDGSKEEPQVVTAGKVTLSRPYTVIHVGLPYTAQLESLNLENAQTGTYIERQKLIKNVTVLVDASRGFKAGTSFDAGTLYEAKWRTTEDYGDPTRLRSGPVDVALDSTWDDNGHWCIEQSDPLPLAVLAVAPSGEVGGD